MNKPNEQKRNSYAPMINNPSQKRDAKTGTLVLAKPVVSPSAKPKTDKAAVVGPVCK